MATKVVNYKVNSQRKKIQGPAGIQTQYLLHSTQKAEDGRLTAPKRIELSVITPICPVCMLNGSHVIKSTFLLVLPYLTREVKANVSAMSDHIFQKNTCIYLL